jgi:hypothetical protein
MRGTAYFFGTLACAGDFGLRPGSVRGRPGSTCCRAAICLLALRRGVVLALLLAAAGGGAIALTGGPLLS